VYVPFHLDFQMERRYNAQLEKYTYNLYLNLHVLININIRCAWRFGFSTEEAKKAI